MQIPASNSPAAIDQMKPTRPQDKPVVKTESDSVEKVHDFSTTATSDTRADSIDTLA